MSLTDNRYEVWPSCLFFKAFDKPYFWMNQIILIFFVFTWTRKWSLGITKVKWVVFYTIFIIPSLKWVFKLPGGTFSGFLEYKAWGKDKYVVINGHDGKDVENGDEMRTNVKQHNRILLCYFPASCEL